MECHHFASQPAAAVKSSTYRKRPTRPGLVCMVEIETCRDVSRVRMLMSWTPTPYT